jgi:hypothetical protein
MSDLEFFILKYISRGMPRDNAMGNDQGGRGVVLSLDRAWGSYPGRSQQLNQVD